MAIDIQCYWFVCFIAFVGQRSDFHGWLIFLIQISMTTVPYHIRTLENWFSPPLMHFLHFNNSTSVVLQKLFHWFLLLLHLSSFCTLRFSQIFHFCWFMPQSFQPVFVWMKEWMDVVHTTVHHISSKHKSHKKCTTFLKMPLVIYLVEKRTSTRRQSTSLNFKNQCVLFGREFSGRLKKIDV